MNREIEKVLSISLIAIMLISSSIFVLQVHAADQEYDLRGTWLWNDIWQGVAYPHTVTISTFNPDGTFSGTGYHNNGPETEDVTGQLIGDSITFHWVTTSEVSNGITLDGTGKVLSSSFMSGTGFQSGGYGPVTWDATRKQNQPPVAKFESLNVVEDGLQEGPHMAGGKIVFDPSASFDPDGKIVKNDWDFGNGTKISVDQPNQYPIIYFEPENYQAKLTVTDDKGLSSTTTEDLDLTLLPGDLILIRTGPPYSTLFNLAGMVYTHVGMYVGKINGVNWMIESAIKPLGKSVIKQDGVQLTRFDRWSADYETYVDVVRVNTDQETKNRAILWAESKEKSKYDIISILDPFPGGTKQLDMADAFAPDAMNKQYRAYYCSELIWAAYYRASGGAVDLSKPYFTNSAIPPDGLYPNLLTQWISCHHEHYPT
jgi:uncharacterized protein YycO